MEGDWRNKLWDYHQERAKIERSMLSQALSDLAGEKLSVIETTRDVLLSEVFSEDEVSELNRFGIFKLGELIASLRFWNILNGIPRFVITTKTETFAEPNHWLNNRIQKVLTDLGLGFLFDDLLIAILLRNTESGITILLPKA